MSPSRSSSFNPCCAGCGFQTASARSQAKKYLEFQSLLCWMWVSDIPTTNHNYPPRPRFNPCCAGCGFQTIESLVGALPDSVFQSLLCWMWVSDTLGCFCGITYHHVSILVVLDVGFRHVVRVLVGCLLDVSILVVLDVGFRPSISIGMPARELFQSLLCWMWVSDLCVKYHNLAARYVSILVVLDVGFRHVRDVTNTAGARVSILVVLDVGFRPYEHSGHAHRRRRFNPCCAGCGFQTFIGGPKEENID